MCCRLPARKMSYPVTSPTKYPFVASCPTNCLARSTLALRSPDKEALLRLSIKSPLGIHGRLTKFTINRTNTFPKLECNRRSEVRGIERCGNLGLGKMFLWEAVSIEPEIPPYIFLPAGLNVAQEALVPKLVQTIDLYRVAAVPTFVYERCNRQSIAA